MPSSVEVLLLVDNTTVVPGLETEHGLSMRVVAGGKHILFDTGMGMALPGNAAALGADLSRTDAIVLSHGHYDHTGGLPHIFDLGVAPTIFMHPEATRMRYGCLQTPPHKAIGMRPAIADALGAREKDIVPTGKPIQITDRLWITGPVPRRNAFEDTGGPFFVDADCLVKDLIPDDQAIWFDTTAGIVVLLGCAHSGVVNTLDYIAELTGTTAFCAVIGGMHLVNASAERLDATAEALQHYKVQQLAPCHCTGENPASFLASRFPAQYATAGAGSRWSWFCGQ